MSGRSRSKRPLRWGAATVLFAATLALALSSVALAGKRTTYVFIHSRYWEVAVDGKIYSVKNGGNLIYHPLCQKLESMTPVVVFTVKGSGVDFYHVAIVGPKPAGTSDGTEKSLTGRRTVTDVPFLALEFTKLTEGTNVPTFPAGVYSAQLLFHAAKPKQVETIKLIGKPKPC